MVAPKRPFIACVTMQRNEARTPTECTELHCFSVAQLSVRGHKLRTLIVVSLVTVVVIGGCVSAAPIQRLYWQHRLDRELPVGSSLLQVNRFFEQARIEHDYDAPSHTLRGIKRNVSGILVVSYGIEYQCHFTSTDVLGSCTTEVYGDGL
jgi:hypothetical protein